jgi:hypothetical protein
MLPLQRLSADLQRPYRHVVGSEQTATPVLDPRHLSPVPRVVVASHCERVGGAYRYQLPLVLVAAQCRVILGNAPSTADAPDLVTQTQAARALQRTQDFLAAIREQVRAHESGTT